jgi:hypothetical protein
MLMANKWLNFMANEMISISPLSTFLTYMYVAMFHHHLYMVFISLSWFDVQELVQHTITFLFEAVYSQTSWWYMNFYSLIYSQYSVYFYGYYNDLVCQYNLPLGQALFYVSHAYFQTVLYTLFPTTDCSVSPIWKWCWQWVWPVDKGGLLLLNTWSYICTFVWYTQRSVSPHYRICSLCLPFYC